MKTYKEYTLETLLLIITDRAIRSRIITRAVEKGVSSDEHHIREAIQLYSQLKLYSNAAKLAERFGLKDDAIKFYYKAKLFGDVFRLDKQNGNNYDKFNLYYKITSSRNVSKITQKKTDLKRIVYSYETDSHIQDTINILREKNAGYLYPYINFLESLL
ncbi:MAG: hypothetical protein ABIH65_00585 [Nanoarchaeota archaeon]